MSCLQEREEGLLLAGRESESEVLVFFNKELQVILRAALGLKGPVRALRVFG